MPIAEPELRRTWLFGPGADAHAHDAMQRSGADALIADLEDFTPPDRRDEARRGLARVLKQWRNAGRIAVVRINALGADGPTDLAAAMPARPDVVAYPMAASAEQMHELHAALSEWESTLGIDSGTTEILPVCETALGVVDVRAIAGGSPRIRAALPWRSSPTSAGRVNASSRSSSSMIRHSLRREPRPRRSLVVGR